MSRNAANGRQWGGFTLVELLVTVAILIVLAALVVIISRRAMQKARTVQCVAQMRDLTSGLQAFVFDYQRAPLPETKRLDGLHYDFIVGDPGGLYGNAFVIAALAGKEGEFDTNTDEILDASYANPKGEEYYTPEVVYEPRLGVFEEDGALYDPWGREIMIAINNPPFRDDFNEGLYDRRLHTWGLAEYEDSKPRDQQFVLWSYGPDGVKAEVKVDSDDVTTW